jgi:hypothetical protein
MSLKGFIEQVLKKTSNLKTVKVHLLRQNILHESTTILQLRLPKLCLPWLLGQHGQMGINLFLYQ